MTHGGLQRRAGCVTLVVVGVIGVSFWAAGDTESPRAAPPPSPPAPMARPGRVAPPPQPTPDLDGLDGAPDATDPELDAAYDAIRELELELYGVPREWDPSTPETHRPEAVAQTIERVLEECGIAFTLLGIGCDEPPCLVSFDVTGHPDAHEALVGCPAWREPWGRRVGQETRTVACDDGTSRRLLVITPGAERVQEDDQGFPVLEGKWTDDAYVENATKRFRARVENLAPSICR